MLHRLHPTGHDFRGAGAPQRRPRGALFDGLTEALRVNGRVLAALLVVGVWGCATAPAADDVAAGSGLISSLDVKVDGDSVQMTLHLTSALETPVVLEFTSAQRSDFAVRDTSGAVLWTWSMDKLFAQVTGTETLAPGGALQYSGTWVPAPPGRYQAVGRVVSTNRPVVIAVPFEVR